MLPIKANKHYQWDSDKETVYRSVQFRLPLTGEETIQAQ